MVDLKKLMPSTKILNALYVEDNDEVRIQTQKLLSKFFNNLDVEVNGQDGLNRYKRYFDQNKKHYDLIITDINMPVLDGLEMSKNILDINIKQQIIVVSAYNDSENLQMCIDTGIKHYIHKPIGLKDITEALSKVVKSIQEDKGSEKHLNGVEKLNCEFDAIINNFDQYVIASRTDLNGIITYASRAYQEISGYSAEELIGQPHRLVSHPDMSKDIFKDMWETIKSEKLWIGEIKNLKKGGTHYWLKTEIAPYYDAFGTHIGYSAIKTDITSQKQAQELNNRISDLLNNAGQGYLSFGEDLKCESVFSKECLSIFSKDSIDGLDITQLLFKDKNSKVDLFIKAINNVLASDNKQNKRLFLSLLPKETIIVQKTISIEYKMLQNNRFMIILTDITEKKELEKELNSQHQIQKMIVEVASNRDDFLELKSEFEDFISNYPKDKFELLRSLHTFKGIFFQKEMSNIANSIHSFESEIKNGSIINNDRFKKLSKSFSKDLNFIKENLQEKFLINNHTFKINNKSIKNIEKKLKSISDNNNINELDEVLFDIGKLRYKPIQNMLNIYPKHLKQMAQKLDKYIYQLKIEGDKNIVASSKIRPFIKSLVHLFNNCIDHGIEDIDKRVQLEKDEMGTVKCSYKKINNILLLEISDDGRGIDVTKLITVVIKKGLLTEQECNLLTMKEKLKLVFIDNLSTKEKTSLTSGRGVGMSAIDKCVTQLGGEIIIENTLGVGVTFRFLIPLDKYPPKKGNSDADIILNSLVKQTKILMRDECDIEAIGDRTIDSIDYSSLTGCNSKIDFVSGYDGSFILCYSKEIGNSLGSVFIPTSFSDDETAMMIKELPAEIINTIAGTSIVDFPKNLGSISISVPVKITPQNRKLIVENKNNTIIIKEINTTKGKIFCILVKNKSCHQTTEDIENVQEMALV